MEIVTSQLSMKLCIEDIDAADGDNPQLCAEYVKEIYEYMMVLEVMLQVLECFASALQVSDNEIPPIDIFIAP